MHEPILVYVDTMRVANKISYQANHSTDAMRRFESWFLETSHKRLTYAIVTSNAVLIEEGFWKQSVFNRKRSVKTGKWKEYSDGNLFQEVCYRHDKPIDCKEIDTIAFLKILPKPNR